MSHGDEKGLDLAGPTVIRDDSRESRETFVWRDGARRVLVYCKTAVVSLDLTRRKIKMRVTRGTEETAETSPQSNTDEKRGARNKLF